MAKSFLVQVKQNETNEGAQDAHEGIRPTSAYRHPDSVKAILSRDQFRLYKLIWERFIASQMAQAVLDTMTVHLVNEGVEFRADRIQG